VDTEDKREFIEVYCQNCAVCKYLNPDADKKFNCHYSKGNTECPASELQIVVVGKAKRYARQVLAARAKRDVLAEKKILELVSKKSQAFIERFYFYLEDGKK